MTILLAMFGFWFAELSTLPQRLTAAFERKMYVMDCTKCLSFWLGLIYFGVITFDVFHSVLMAGITSLIGMVLSRIYYKTLS